MAAASEASTADQATGSWPWAFAAGGVLFLIGGLLHPGGDSTLPEPQATAAVLGATTWVPAHAFILAGTIGFLLGLLGLARSSVPLSTAARRAAWVATVGAALLSVEGVFHLAAVADQAAVLAGAATPFLSTHMVLAVVVYPLFTFAVAALALLSGHALAHPVVCVIGAIGAVGFGVAPALVGLAGIEALDVLFPIGGIIIALWFAVVGVTALLRRSARRSTAAAAG